MAAKMGELIANRARKEQFLWSDFGDLEVQMGVEDVTSPIVVLGIIVACAEVGCTVVLKYCVTVMRYFFCTILGTVSTFSKKYSFWYHCSFFARLTWYFGVEWN